MGKLFGGYNTRDEQLAAQEREIMGGEKKAVKKKVVVKKRPLSRGYTSADAPWLRKR